MARGDWAIPLHLDRISHLMANRQSASHTRISSSLADSAYAVARINPSIPQVAQEDAIKKIISGRIFKSKSVGC